MKRATGFMCWCELEKSFVGFGSLATFGRRSMVLLSADMAGRMGPPPWSSTASPSPMDHSGGIERVSQSPSAVRKPLAPPGAVAGTLARRADRGMAGKAGRMARSLEWPSPDIGLLLIGLPMSELA